jgi:hypothetical protein
MPARTDGKIIKAASVSVQTNQTYEEQFALEMEKAKVSTSCREHPVTCHWCAW